LFRQDKRMWVSALNKHAFFVTFLRALTCDLFWRLSV